MRSNFFPPSKLIAPLFLDQETFDRPLDYKSEPLKSIPGFYRLTKLQLVAEVAKLLEIGLKSFLIYPIIDHKLVDLMKDPHSIVAKDLFLLSAIKEIKEQFPEINLVLDLCLCHFNSRSQCGIECDGQIENETTLELLGKLAVNLAEAGADALMISGMIDGAVSLVRQRLEENGFHHVVLMVQSAKLDSALYGPFHKIQLKEVHQNQKATYQLNPGNSRQARREIAADLQEGADIIVLKPTMTSLDFLAGLPRHDRPPVFAYTTGGEYSLLSQSTHNDAADALKIFNAYFRNLERAGICAVVSYASAPYAQLLTDQPGPESNQQAI